LTQVCVSQLYRVVFRKNQPQSVPEQLWRKGRSSPKELDEYLV